MGAGLYIGTSAPYVSVGSGVRDLQLTLNMNTYKLQKKTYDSNAWVNVGSFSRAVASWNLRWGGGRFTATANPQGQNCWTELVPGTPSWSGTTVTIPINAVHSLSQQTPVYTGKSVTATYSGGGGDYPYTKTLTCTGKTPTGSSYKYTFEYTINNANLWTVGDSYKFHHNSNYS